MTGRKRRTLIREDGVDGIPCHERALVSARQVGLIVVVIYARRHARQRPRFGFEHADAVLGILKVVDIRGVVLRAAGLPCYQLGKLARKRNLRRLLAVQEGQHIEHIGKPLALLFPVHVQSPQRILQRFGTHGHLRGKRLLAQMLYSTAYLELFREVVLPVQPEHRFPLHAIVGIAFQRHADGCAGIDDTLVQDGNLACRIVDAIVGALGQHHSSRRYHDRALRHVVCPQRNDIGRRALILPHEHKLIFLGYLLCCRLGGVVKFLKSILGSRGRCNARLLHLELERRAERFGRGEEHTPAAYGISVDIVEAPVCMHFIIIVQAVAAHQVDEHSVLYLRFGQIRKVYARCVALVFHVETELGPFYRRGEVVDVFHHQLPVGLCGRIAGIAQRLDEQCLTGIRVIRCELAHLIGLPVERIFESHSQHLVGLQRCFQRDVSQRRVNAVFRR